MLETRSADILSAALVETLETMAFMSAMPPMDALAAPADPVLVTLRFRGERAGELLLAATTAMGAQLAENILGPADDPATVPQRGCDALGELANVLAGTYLRHADPHPARQYEMSLPEVRNVDAAAWQALADDPAGTPFDVEGQPFVLLVREIP